MRLTGTVESILPERRLFRVSDGRTAVVFRAGPQVKNFGELETGDRVTLDYYESVAIGMADPADPGTAIGEVALGAAAPGEKPAGVAAGAVTMVVEFLSYDSRPAAPCCACPMARWSGCRCRARCAPLPPHDRPATGSPSRSTAPWRSPSPRLGARPGAARRRRRAHPTPSQPRRRVPKACPSWRSCVFRSGHPLAHPTVVSG